MSFVNTPEEILTLLNHTPQLNENQEFRGYIYAFEFIQSHKSEQRDKFSTGHESTNTSILSPQ